MPTIQPAPRSAVDFEAVYADAARDATRIPWAHRRPHPALVTWLNVVAPSLIRCGARVAVVGCGLGDDAREIARRGYDVTAFDCSETAIAWAREIEPDRADCFRAADVFDLPTRWHHRFDLVVEINTIQALPVERRDDTMRAISTLLSPNGHLLVICRGRHEHEPLIDGPPWPFTTDELELTAAAAGLVPTEPLQSFEDDGHPSVLRIRGLLQRRR